MLIIGGSATDTLPEFWSPYDATIHAYVPGTPKALDLFTVDAVGNAMGNTTAVGNTIIACEAFTCERLSEGSWVPHCNTLHQRSYHTSVVHDGKILLTGGISSPTTTEWVKLDGSVEEGFLLQESLQNHCSISLENPPSMILTGGKYTGVLVTQYSLPNGDVLSMSDLTEARENHACGVNQTSEGSQVG